MMKKFLAAILAVAMVAAMWAVPVSASSFTDSLFFNADFTAGSANDTAGGIVPEMTGINNPPALEFVDSAVTGTKVASFDGKKALSYNIDYTKVVANFTMEAYVNFSVDQVQNGKWGLIAGTFWNNKTGFGFMFRELSGIGVDGKLAFTRGNSSALSNMAGSTRYKGGWQHLTYVHDGANEHLYVDGVLVASQPAVNIPSDTTKGFRIGGYNLANNFDLTMECAYVRLYQSAATGADVAALYENRNLPASTPGPVVPTAIPDPTEAPSGKLFEVDFSTGAGDDTTGNYVVSQDDFGENCTIEYDDQLKANVAVFDGWGGISYTSSMNLNGYDLTDGITLETYVYLNDVQASMIFLETTGTGLSLQQYNSAEDQFVGFRCGDLNSSGGFEMRNAYTEQGTILESGKWVHLIGTSDGLTNRFYIDGQLIISLDRTQSKLQAHPAAVAAATNLRVGADVLFGNSPMKGKIAFARIYKNAVDDTEAAELYYTVNPEARPDEPTAAPTEEPTPEPTEEPIPAPLTVTYTSGKTDGKKTDAVALNETFSIEVYAIPTDNGYLVFNARYPVELDNGHIGVWEFTHPGVSFTSNAEVKIGEPVHLVITGSGDTLKLYVNGQYDSSTSGEMVLGNDDFNFGHIMQLGVNAGSEYVFNVYNREATAEEVVELYEPYKPAPKREGNIILQSKPSKMYYAIGEELDLTGMKVATKIDGVTTPIAVEDCEITGFDSSVAGNVRISVKYETADAIFTNFFTLRILPEQPQGVIAIGLATKPAKLYYSAGEELDTTGLTILAKNADGTTAYVSEGLEVTGYDATVSGVQRLTVTYQGKTTSFSVKVAEKPSVIGIGLQTKPVKLNYAYGEALDTTGLTILAKYSDGTIVRSISEGVEVTGYNAKVSGAQRLTVTYQGKSTSFTVKVAEAKLEETVVKTFAKTGQKRTNAINLPENFTIELYLNASTAGQEICTGGLIAFEVNADGTVGSWITAQGGNPYIHSKQAITIGDPVHVVLVGAGTDLTLYVNGEYADAKGASDNVPVIGGQDFNPTKSLKFGTTEQTGSLTFYGKAATADEVAALYAAR